MQDIHVCLNMAVSGILQNFSLYIYFWISSALTDASHSFGNEDFQVIEKIPLSLFVQNILPWWLLLTIIKIGKNLSAHKVQLFVYNPRHLWVITRRVNQKPLTQDQFLGLSSLLHSLPLKAQASRLPEAFSSSQYGNFSIDVDRTATQSSCRNSHMKHSSVEWSWWCRHFPEQHKCSWRVRTWQTVCVSNQKE